MKKILSFILISLVFIGCVDKKDDKTIRISAILPLTGEISTYGKGCKNGIEIALDSINKYQINVVVDYYDDKGITKESLMAFNKAILNNSKIVIGPITSASAMAIIENNSEALVFSPTASSPDLLNRSNLFLRNWSSDALEATAMARYVQNNNQWLRIGVVYVNNDYGISLAQTFQKVLNENGYSVFMQAGEPNMKNYRNHIAKILNYNVDAIYIIGYHNDLITFTKQIREMDYSMPILSSSNFETEDLFNALGNLINDVIYCTCEIPQNTSSYIAFEKSYLAKFNKQPDVFAKNSYDIMMLLWRSLSDKNNSMLDIVDNIKAVPYIGVTGEMRFLENGDVVRPVAIKQIKDGRIQIIDIIDYEQN